MYDNISLKCISGLRFIIQVESGNVIAFLFLNNPSTTLNRINFNYESHYNKEELYHQCCYMDKINH